MNTITSPLKKTKNPSLNSYDKPTSDHTLSSSGTHATAIVEVVLLDSLRNNSVF